MHMHSFSKKKTFTECLPLKQQLFIILTRKEPQAAVLERIKVAVGILLQQSFMHIFNHKHMNSSH